MPLPLALVLGPPLVKAAIGGFQALRGQQKLNELDRPTRSTSPAIAEGAARTRYMAQAGKAPGSKIAREQITTNQAGAVSQISKAGGTASTTMAAAIGAQATANRGNQQQTVQDQRFKLGANMQYMQMLKQMAQEHQMNFRWNQAQKFEEDASAARRLTESGLQNFAGGISEAGGSAYAHQGLNVENNENSKYWNQKLGYMGTQEQYDASQAANMANYQKTLAGPQAPAVSNPMHGQFGEGINSQGYMNDLSFLQKLLPMPIGPQ